MNMRVLVADRDPTALDAYRLFLEGCGYEVETAGNGMECFEKLVERPPDALVLEQDLLWGGADGVVARMQDEWNVPLVPVVLIVDEGSRHEVFEPSDGPVVATLQKPFRMSALLHCLMPAEPGHVFA